MAISLVRAQINGTWYTLTESAGQWKASITAPGATSFHQPGGYYNVTVEVTNDAGTTVTADASSLESLKLIVKETVKPVINILSPSSGAYVTNNKQPIVFTVTDEAGGSGVDLSSISVKVDGNPITDISTSAITNGYSVTATPDTVLSDGAHSVTVDASDNDGNDADQKSVTFTVDTVPPTLNITAPAEGLITNTALINVKGVTNDVTSSPVSISIKLNNVDQGAVSVDSGGNFTKQITLTEGQNTISVTATDAAGKTSAVTRTVTLDTSVPQIESASITPNPVDAGGTMIITVVIQ